MRATSPPSLNTAHNPPFLLPSELSTTGLKAISAIPPFPEDPNGRSSRMSRSFVAVGLRTRKMSGVVEDDRRREDGRVGEKFRWVIGWDGEYVARMIKVRWGWVR
jgi:hypothetical protein